MSRNHLFDPWDTRQPTAVTRVFYWNSLLWEWADFQTTLYLSLHPTSGRLTGGTPLAYHDDAAATFDDLRHAVLTDNRRSNARMRQTKEYVRESYRRWCILKDIAAREGREKDMPPPPITDWEAL